MTCWMIGSFKEWCQTGAKTHISDETSKPKEIQNEIWQRTKSYNVKKSKYGLNDLLIKDWIGHKLEKNFQILRKKSIPETPVMYF